MQGSIILQQSNFFRSDKAVYQELSEAFDRLGYHFYTTKNKSNNSTALVLKDKQAVVVVSRAKTSI